MPSEARRGIIRIAANYTRLFMAVCLGLVLVRLVIQGAGNEAWGLISLVGATVGVAAMLQDIVRASMIRELGEAHHAGPPERFLATYNSAILITTGVGVIALAALVVVILILPVLNIPDELIGAARWLVGAKAVETLIVLVLGAPLNMYVATERMIVFNMWMVIFRACMVAAAVWVFLVQGIDDPAQGIIAYALLSSGLTIVAQVSAAVLIMILDRRLIPRPSRVTRSAVRELLRIGGWNAAAITSTSAHVQIDNILMNLFFGLFGNLIFGLTTQLTSYVRMLAMGITFGLDAVSARLSTAGGTDSVRRLCYHATKLNGVVALPAAVGLIVLAEPILLTWLGDRLEDPARTVPATVLLVRIMAIGMVCRAICDGWLKILYGAGHVARYAPLIVAAALANPVIAIVLFFTLPEPVRFTGAAVAYTTVFVAVNMGVIPRLVARLLEMRTVEVVAPLLRPFIITAVCTPVLILAATRIEPWSLLRLGAVAAVFGAIYALLTLVFVFEPEERQRVMGVARRMLRV